MSDKTKVPELLKIFEQITTLSLSEVIGAVGDPDKETELLHKMSENIRREAQAKGKPEEKS